MWMESGRQLDPKRQGDVCTKTQKVGARVEPNEQRLEALGGMPCSFDRQHNAGERWEPRQGSGNNICR